MGGKDTKLERTVALKLLLAHLLGNEEIRVRFEREAKAAAGLHDPNICPVHEIDEAEVQSFIYWLSKPSWDLRMDKTKEPRPICSIHLHR